MQLERKTIVHFERSPGIGVCGSEKVQTTPLRGDVTCPRCAEAMPAAETWAIGEERELARGAHALTLREAQLVARSVAGEDEEERTRWRSLDAAFAQYVRVIDDGTPMRSSFRNEMPVQGGTGNVRATGREEVIAVEVALERAFTAPRTFREVTLSAGDQRRIFELVRFGRVETKRTAPGRKGSIRWRVPCSASEVAERDLGGALTAHEVGVVVRAGNTAIARHLVEKGELRERASGEERREGKRAEGDEMAKMPGYDVEGVKEIAQHLDLSPTTVKRLMAREARPLPVRKYLAFILAKKSELDAWREAELADPVRSRDEPDPSQMDLDLRRDG